MIFIDFQRKSLIFYVFSMISLNLWLLAPTNVAPSVDPYSRGCRRQWRQPLNCNGNHVMGIEMHVIYFENHVNYFEYKSE